MGSAYITNPATGRRVLRSGRIGRQVIKTREEKKKKKKPKSAKAKAKASWSKACKRRRSARTCGSDPDCEWRSRSRSCVRRKGVRGGAVAYEGPRNVSG